MQQDQDHNLGHNENAELDSEISEPDIRDAVFSQKNNKRCGTDFFNAELYLNVSMTSFLRFLSACSTVYYPMVSIRHLGLKA